MKLGRFIPLGTYKDVKIGYGTINHKDLKSIYLKLNSWIEPNKECTDYDSIVRSSRNDIKRLIHGLNNDSFRPQSIVDLDIRTKGIKKEKRSFMNLECTLYVLKDLPIKSDELRLYMKSLMVSIIDECLNNDLFYNFHKNKK